MCLILTQSKQSQQPIQQQGAPGLDVVELSLPLLGEGVGLSSPPPPPYQLHIR
jgi:hypothetical protein